MGLKNWLHNKRMTDPVRGSYQLTGCSVSSGGASYENCRMYGVVTGPGLPPTAVEHYCTAPTSRWPQVGSTLPVTVDRADPTRLNVDWGQVPTNRDQARRQAEQQAGQLAARLGGEGLATQPPASSSTLLPPPDPSAGPETTYGLGAARSSAELPPELGEEVRGLLDRLVSDARAAGATVTTNVDYRVVGAPGRPVPGVPGGGLNPDQAQAVQHDRSGFVAAQARVIAVHDVVVPPGLAGGGTAGTVDLTLDVLLPSGEGFATTLRIAFSTPERRARVATVGASLAVLVDPDAHDRVAIDTSGL